MKRLLILSICAAIAVAQSRLTFSLVAQDGGHVALGLAVRKLSVSGTFMQAPAHPDDETNALFAYFGFGKGLRTVDVQNDRGGDRAHEATTVLVREAYRVSGNPEMYPEQIRAGLHAWKPKKLYFAGG